MKIVTLKFTNGEEVLARLEQVGTEDVIISAPMAVSVVQIMTKDGPVPQLQLVPWLVSAQGLDKVSILKSNLLFEPVESDKNIADGYIRNTTNIQIA